MSNDAWVIWICFTVAFCTLVTGTATWAITTAGKDNDATYAARIHACVDSGGSYIGSECVKVQCVP